MSKRQKCEHNEETSSVVKSEPGGSQFGSFIDYYRFHLVITRIESIPDTLLSEGFAFAKLNTLLDIGCNAGNLTVALHQHLTSGFDESSTSRPPLHILGIDLDESLIKRCQDHNPLPEYITYGVVNIMNTSQRSGFIEKYLRDHEKKRFTLVTCFSISMWIHVNHGDEGLRDWLRYVASITESILIEPQPWKCYRSAARRLRKLNCQQLPHLDKLQWTHNVDTLIVNFLVDECKMVVCKDFGKNDWKRRLLYLKHREI